MIPNILPTEKIQLCINQADIFSSFEIVRLKENMRVIPNEVDFTKWLVTLGDGMLPRYKELSQHSIRLPTECVLLPEKLEDGNIKYPNEDDLIQFTFGDNINNITDCRAILCPLNEDALRINEKIIRRIDGI